MNIHTTERIPKRTLQISKVANILIKPIFFPISIMLLMLSASLILLVSANLQIAIVNNIPIIIIAMKYNNINNRIKIPEFSPKATPTIPKSMKNIIVGTPM